MTITLAASSTLNPTGTTQPGPTGLTVPLPSGYTPAIGDYALLVGYWAQASYLTSVTDPTNGWTKITLPNQNGARLFQASEYRITDSVALSAFAAQTQKVGASNSRYVGQMLIFKGVDLTKTTIVSILEFGTASSAAYTFAQPGSGDAKIFFLGTNTSSPSTGPAFSSTGGTKLVSNRSLDVGTGSSSDSQLTTFQGGTGATSAVNTANHMSYGIGLFAAPDAPLGLNGVYTDDSGVAHHGYMFYNDASNVKHVVDLPDILFQPYTVTQMMANANLGHPWFSAHRGGSYNYPEETLDGYRACTQRGLKILEVSVQYSSDGTPWCFHDANTSRTTGVTATISATNDATLSALSNLGSTATGNPTQRSRPVAKLVDVIAAFSDTHVLIIEDKTYTHMTSLLALLATYGTTGRPASERFIIKMSATGNTALFSQARSAGYKTWGYIFDDEMAAGYATALTRAIDMMGLDYNSTDATLSPAITQAINAGMMPTGHIVPSRTIKNRLLGLGMKGIMMSNIDAVFD